MKWVKEADWCSLHADGGTKWWSRCCAGGAAAEDANAERRTRTIQGHVRRKMSTGGDSQRNEERGRFMFSDCNRKVEIPTAPRIAQSREPASSQARNQNKIHIRGSSSRYSF